MIYSLGSRSRLDGFGIDGSGFIGVSWVWVELEISVQEAGFVAVTVAQASFSGFRRFSHEL